MKRHDSKINYISKNNRETNLTLEKGKIQKVIYKRPVLVNYGVVSDVIEAGGQGSLDIFLGPTFC